MPEFGFNGIGDLTPGYGYQIKVTEEINGFSLCDWYVNDIPEDNIVSLQEGVEELSEENTNLMDSLSVINSLVESLNEENTNLMDSLGVINSQIGCTDSLACNFDLSYLYEDGSCQYPPFGYSCDGDYDVSIGDTLFGGIVFYINSDGQSGLVAAKNNIGKPLWGCMGINVNGADGANLGWGLQNTLDIYNYGCTNPDGSATAAEVALNYIEDGYDDWFLPSIEELALFFNNLSYNENTWSSTEHSLDEAYCLSYPNTSPNSQHKENDVEVRPIRAFGDWTLGCMDESACTNYNPEANMLDGSCDYPEQGYDCDNNFILQVGDEYEGGRILYIDETGSHGIIGSVQSFSPTNWSSAMDIASNYVVEQSNTYLWCGAVLLWTSVPYNGSNNVLAMFKS